MIFSQTLSTSTPKVELGNSLGWLLAMFYYDLSSDFQNQEVGSFTRVPGSSDPIEP